MASNSTFKSLCQNYPSGTLCFSSYSQPFYHSDRPALISGIPDPILTVASPILAYWFLSLFFHSLDSFDGSTSFGKYLEKYRIHESAQVKSKNIVSKAHVVWAVIFQQIVQTFLGLFWMGDDFNGEGHDTNMVLEMHSMARMLEPVVGALTGALERKLRLGEAELLGAATYYMYWWIIPTAQLLFAMFIIDTWQYFLHRLMHVNKFLYKHFHSWHHRLYVPYAYGALYNHPVEGFLLDSLGAAIAESAMGMNPRQAMLLFVVSTLKTVDDHCGYRLPFDVLQMVTANNADYHDIHHQVIGIKSNFSQPFFIHWDTILGTRMTREELEARKRKTSTKVN